MKGFLTFLTLWLIQKGKNTGAEISTELEKRKGNRPSPGTIYPVLKFLKENKLIKTDEKDKEKKYYLTKEGEEELQAQLDFFFNTFSDIDEMKRCGCRKRQRQHREK